jgi:hypothetical protein
MHTAWQGACSCCAVKQGTAALTAEPKHYCCSPLQSCSVLAAEHICLECGELNSACGFHPAGLFAGVNGFAVASLVLNNCLFLLSVVLLAK